MEKAYVEARECNCQSKNNTMMFDLIKKFLFLLMYVPSLFLFIYHALDVIFRPNTIWFLVQKILFVVLVLSTIGYLFFKKPVKRISEKFILFGAIPYIILAIVNKLITLLLFVVFLYGGFVWSVRLFKDNPFIKRKKNLSPEARKKLTYNAFIGLFLIVFFFFLTRFILSELWQKEEKQSSQAGWSSNQGPLGWYEAREKCKSLKMKLPTLEELKKAKKEKLTKSWLNFGEAYWSSSPFGTNGHYYLNVKTSEEFFGIPSDEFYTRCFRLQ